MVRPTETAFMQGTNILDGVVILHETVHEMHRKKLNGVIFKIDFEKAYDKVNVFLNEKKRPKNNTRISASTPGRNIESTKSIRTTPSDSKMNQ